MVYLYIMLAICILAILSFLTIEVIVLKKKVRILNNNVSPRGQSRNARGKNVSSCQEEKILIKYQTTDVANISKELPVYPDITFPQWVDSVYDINKKWVLDNATANIMDCLNIHDLGKVSLVVYCSFVDINSECFRFKICDPFGEMWTEPISRISNSIPADEIGMFGGRILLLEGNVENGKLKISEIKRSVYQKEIC